MKKILLLSLVVSAWVLSKPAVLYAEYQYTGTAALQPFAVIEPATPDGLFHSWTGEVEQNGRTNLGMTLDFLRNADNSNDWDVFWSTTGSYRYSEKLVFGLTLPVIIRDGEFNKSDPLDLHGFARMRLAGRASGFGVSGELSTILPTARTDAVYPYSLDSPVVGFRLAFAGGSSDLRLGLNAGYQTYLQTESGNDSDIIYSTWMKKDLKGSWDLVFELYGSQHAHSGQPEDDKVSDNYLLVGASRVHSDRTTFGIAASSGLGGGKAADLRITALATVKFGTVPQKAAAGRAEERKRVEEKVQPERKVEVKRKEAAPKKVTPAPAPGAITVVMIAEGVAGTETQKRITRALQKEGFATGMDPNPGIRNKGRNILYYMPGMKDRAQNVSNALVAGGYLKDLRIEESKIRLPGGWLLLMPGGEK